jgi:hypothetical protein
MTTIINCDLSGLWLTLPLHFVGITAFFFLFTLINPEYGGCAYGLAGRRYSYTACLCWMTKSKWYFTVPVLRFFCRPDRKTKLRLLKSDKRASADGDRCIIPGPIQRHINKGSSDLPWSALSTTHVLLQKPTSNPNSACTSFFLTTGGCRV